MSSMPPSPELPSPEEVMRAIDIFLGFAYVDGTQPNRSVQAGLSELRQRKADTFYQSPLFIKPAKDAPPGSYTLRLGNQFYPHMKLTMQPTPDGQGTLYRADTHDRHLCPAQDHPEYQAFLDLRGKNQRIAERIESAWGEAGICTFRTYLQNDLRRRREQQSP